MTPYPQAGELWCYKRNPSLMVLVLGMTKSKNLVLTRSLFRDREQAYRGTRQFQETWRPVTKEDT